MSTPPFSASTSTFVGREAELATLDNALNSVFSGRGQFVLVSGEPGIGKTRLASECATAAQNRGALVLWGRCWEGDGTPAFWSWVQIIRTLVQQCDSDTLAKDMGAGAAHIAHVVSEVREQLPSLSTIVSTESEHARFRFFDSLTCWFKKVATRQPLLLILDDLHWADTSSLLLLQFLAREISDARLFMIGTYRDTEVNHGHPLAEALGTLARTSQRLPLGGLAEAEVADFVAGAGLHPSEAFVTTLCKETEGNPFFLAEVIHLLAREEKPSLASLPIPHGVRATIRRRLAHLSSACVQILTLAAVIGREFTFDLLCQSHGVQTESERLRLLTWLQEALTARLLSEATDHRYRYRFVHALVRETLYEDIPLPERPHLHRQVGEAIEVLYAGYLKPHLAELADHFCKAAAGGASEKALQYATQAGERANALLAYEEAATYYERALQLLPLQDATEYQRGELLLLLGHALVRAGEPKRARTTFTQAAAIARKLRAQSESSAGTLLLVRAALGFAGRGDIATRFDQPMVSLLEEALAVLPMEDSTYRVRVLSRLAMALYFSPASDQCNIISQRAVAMARRLGDKMALAYALNARQIALIGPDTVHERLELATEVIHLAETEGRKELVLAGHLGRIMGFLELGDRHAVDVELQKYMQLVAELRQPFYLWHGTILRAMSVLLEGRLTEAEELAQEALALGQRVQTPNAILLFTVQLFSLRREQGRLQELEDASRSLLERFPAIPGLRTGLAFLYSELGREREARAEFEQLAVSNFTNLVRDQGWLGSVTNLSQVAFFLKDKERASILYDMLLPYVARNVIIGSANDCFGAAARYLGLLATTMERWDDAIRHFEDALAINTRVGAKLFVAHTQYDYASMLLMRGALGDQACAQSLLNQALATAQELGMKRLVDKISSSKSHILSFQESSQYSVISSQPPKNSSAHPAISRQAAPSAQPLDAGGRTPEAASRPFPANILCREGDYWTISYEGTVVRLQDAKGLHHLNTLLREPHREFHVFDLLAMTDGLAINNSGTTKHEAQLLHLHSSTDSANSRPLPDRQARAIYQQRLENLREELAEAERFNDSTRANKLYEEIDFLTQELATAYGAGTHARKRNENVEKVRKTITHRIRMVLTKIKTVHPPLWRHLFTALKTGTFCSYNPEKPTEWQV